MVNGHCVHLVEDNRKIHESVVDDIVGCKGRAGEPNPQGGTYCLLRDLLEAGVFGLDDRTLEQIACVKKFKYERKINGEQDGWKEAWNVWAAEGHAERFAAIYKPGMKVDEIYSKMFPNRNI